jgi:tape measure domain-containing protein
MANPSVNIVINAVNNAKRQLQDATKDLDSFKQSVLNAKNMLIGLAGVSLSGAFIKGLIDTADKWLTLNAQIRNSTGSSEEFVVAQQAVIDISRKTYTSLEANAGLFSKINLAIKAMGGDSKQSINAVDQIAKLVALSGTSAEAAAAGIFQFTQSLAANRFSGQEYNSVAEQTPALLKAIYEGLNVNIGTLRKLAEEGALDTATVLAAIEKSTARTNAAFDKLPVTFSKASQNMANAWLEFIGRLNESEGVTSTLGAGINYLADNMDTLGKYALKFIAIGLVVSFAKLTTSVTSAYQAMKLARLEAQANAVANAQLQAEEEARLATLAATVAAQEADIRAKIAETEATITLLTAQEASIKAQLEQSTTIAGTTVLTGMLERAQLSLAESQALLAKQQKELTIVQTEGSLAMSKFTLATKALSGAIGALVGWEIGNWFRESFVWYEKLGVLFGGVIAFVMDFRRVLSAPLQFGKDIADQLKAVGNESIAEQEARAEADKKAAEEAKANEELKVQAIADGIKKSQAKLEALNAARKSSYEQDLRNLDQAEQAKLAALNNALPERLKVEDRYQGAKLAVSQAGALTEQQRLAQQTALEIGFNNQRLALAKQFNEQKLADVSRVFDAEIATMRSRNLATDQLEKESNDAKKAILQELERSYETSISKLTALDQQHRNKAVGYLNDINAQEQNRLNQLRSLDAQGLSDTQATELRKRQIIEDTATVKKLLADGEYAKAADLSRKLQELTFAQAQATKQAAAEANKAKAGTGDDNAALVARRQYNDSVNLTTQALQSAANAETQQANIAKTEADKQRTALEQVRATIADIDAAITKGNTLKVSVDQPSMNAAEEALNNVARDRTSTITAKTIQGRSGGGLIQRFATGGAAAFRRGFVRGAGTTTSDSIPAYLSDQEYVVRAQSTKSVGVGVLDYINRFGKLPGFATGGPVVIPDYVSAQFNRVGLPNLGAMPNSAGRASETINLNLSMNGVSETGVFPKTDSMKALIEQLNAQKRVARRQ